MTRETELIHGYFDDTLSDSQISELNDWLKADPANAQRFAREALLHDRLFNLFSLSPDSTITNESANVSHSLSESKAIIEDRSIQPRPKSGWRVFSVPMLTTAASLLIVSALAIWVGSGPSTVSAAARELDRLILANETTLDQTYRISVKETSAPAKPPRESPAKPSRPPKVPLDGAMLYVREGNRFVLARATVDGGTFITGSNGRTSWAVRPDGPVRVSPDLNRFNRDVPGHEHSMPLYNIHDGLTRMREVYDVRIEDGKLLETTGLPQNPSPPTPLLEDVARGGGATDSSQALLRKLVAVKRRGYRGPKQVEIYYEAASGHIRQMEFIEMPYGPELLTVRLSLVDESSLDAEFFEHTFHHSPDRIVVVEE
jgi:hypothetical protein